MEELPKYINANGIINEKRLFDQLYGCGVNRRFKPVLSPSAHATIPCKLRKKEEAVIKNILSAYNNEIFQLRCVNACLELQLLYGLRISEVLNIKCNDIMRNNQIKIKGIKSSGNRIITPVKYIDYFNKCKTNHVNPFDIVNRFYIYREYKKYGINLNYDNNSHNAVTHSLRYLLLKMYDNEGVSMTDIQKQIGHKSINSTKIYVNKR